MALIVCLPPFKRTVPEQLDRLWVRSAGEIPRPKLLACILAVFRFSSHHPYSLCPRAAENSAPRRLAAAPTGLSNHVLTGLVVFALFAASTAGQLALERVPQQRALPIGCLILIVGVGLVGTGIGTASLIVLLTSAVVAGLGQGLGFRAGLASVTAQSPSDRRGEVLEPVYPPLCSHLDPRHRRWCGRSGIRTRPRHSSVRRNRRHPVRGRPRYPAETSETFYRTPFPVKIHRTSLTEVQPARPTSDFRIFLFSSSCNAR